MGLPAQVRTLQLTYLFVPPLQTLLKQTLRPPLLQSHQIQIPTPLHPQPHTLLLNTPKHTHSLVKTQPQTPITLTLLQETAKLPIFRLFKLQFIHLSILSHFYLLK